MEHMGNCLFVFVMFLLRIPETIELIIDCSRDKWRLDDVCYILDCITIYTDVAKSRLERFDEVSGLRNVIFSQESRS